MSRTGFYTHPDCRKHEMGAGHPECPERLDAIHNRMLVTGLADVLDQREAPLASLADTVARLLPAPGPDLLAELTDRCGTIPAQ